MATTVAANLRWTRRGAPPHRRMERRLRRSARTYDPGGDPVGPLGQVRPDVRLDRLQPLPTWPRQRCMARGPHPGPYPGSDRRPRFARRASAVPPPAEGRGRITSLRSRPGRPVRHGRQDAADVGAQRPKGRSSGPENQPRLPASVAARQRLAAAASRRPQTRAIAPASHNGQLTVAHQDHPAWSHPRHAACPCQPARWAPSRHEGVAGSSFFSRSR